MIIGCDIGGVVRDMVSGEPVLNSVETLDRLTEEGYQIIFISKCKESFQELLTEWLKKHKLDCYKVFFVLDAGDKEKIMREQKIDIMIDDKITVLNNCPEGVHKIWFCSEKKKIDGTIKYNPECLVGVSIVKSWMEIFLDMV